MEVKGLYNDSAKTWKKEREDTRTWKDTLNSWARQMDIVECHPYKTYLNT